jgi:hypothetical protein
MDYYSAIKGMRYPYKNRNEVPSNYTEWMKTNKMNV